MLLISGAPQHLACQIGARAFGYRIIGIDHGSKEEITKSSGAEHFIDFTKSKDLGESVQALTNGLGAKAVLVLTAANSAYASAMSMLSFGGTLVCVGIPEGDLVPIAQAFPGTILQKEQRIVGSAVGNRREAIETLALAQRGIVKLHSRTAKMDELTKVFEEMHAGKLQGRVVLELD